MEFDGRMRREHWTRQNKTGLAQSQEGHRFESVALDITQYFSSATQPRQSSPFIEGQEPAAICDTPR